MNDAATRLVKCLERGELGPEPANIFQLEALAAGEGLSQP